MTLSLSDISSSDCCNLRPSCFGTKVKSGLIKKEKVSQGLLYLKFRNFEEATKTWKNLPIYLTLHTSNVEKIGFFFQNFVAFSEYLNFTSKWGVSILEFVLKFLKPYCFICEFRIIQYLTEKNKIIIAFEILGLLT